MSRTHHLVLFAALVSGCGASRYAARPVTIERPGCAAPFTVISTVDGRVAGEDNAMEDVLEDTVVFSRDGRHTAYVARQGTSWFVVHDGERSKAWHGIGFLRYGEVGPIYAAQFGERWCVQRGAADDPCFGTIYEDSLTVAGPSVAYVARSADAWAPAAAASSLVIDGVVALRAAELSLVRASADGKTIGAVERAVAPEVADKLYVNAALVVSAPHLTDWTPSGGVTWVATRDAGLFVESARRTWGPYEKVSRLVSRGDHVAFVGSMAQGREVVLDGVKVGPFADVAVPSLVLSPSGDDFAVVVRLVGGEIKIATRRSVLTPVEGSPVTGVSELVFSPDGVALGALAAAENRQFTISLYGAATGERLWSQGGFGDASDLAVAAQGARVLALTRTGAVTSVFAHCPKCDGPPKLTAVRAMPGTLVTDPALSAWGVVAGEGPVNVPSERRMIIARSWGVGPLDFDARLFGAAVTRFERQGTLDPVVAAWRSQVRSQLTRHLGCPAPAP